VDNQTDAVEFLNMLHLSMATRVGFRVDSQAEHSLVAEDYLTLFAASSTES